MAEESEVKLGRRQSEAGFERRLRAARHFWRRFSEYPAAVVGLAIVFTAVIVALFAPVIAPHRPFELQPVVLGPPSADFPLGTNTVGRDILSYIVYGTRIALLFGLGVGGISLLLGIVMGAIPAYFGGLLDDLVSRFSEMILIIPRLVLVIMIIALLGNNMVYTALVLGLTYWPSNARIVRSQVLSLKNRVFVRAAVASGAGHLRVLFSHILPNGLYPVIVNSSLQMGQAILFEAGLSFLGLGDPNFPSWGQLLADANVRKWAWWMSLFPGAAIMLLVLGFTLVGDGINHAVNPRLRRGLADPDFQKQLT